jgi:flagellar basal-body rod modification protein FlgD
LSQKDTFLKLLVAQIKNQDPLNPTDGLQFVSQLTQFSELEQIMQIRDGIDGLREDLKSKETETAASSGSSTTGV